MANTQDWGIYNDLSEQIEQAQAATVRITRSTAVMISDRYAITAAHSPLDENNEITPGLTVQNLWGEVRDIVNVFYDVAHDFAIVELASPFDNSYSVKLADEFGAVGEDAFIVGHPWTVANAGIGWAVAFGTTYPEDNPDPGWVSFDLDVQGGFSGSGIYNDKGELLAVLSVSYSGGDNNQTPYFNEDLAFQNSYWDIRNGWWAAGPGVEYIKEFMATYDVINVPQYVSELPDNKPDPQSVTFLNENDLAIATALSEIDRQSSVLVSDAGAENTTDYQLAGGGSGTILHDGLILTVAHALDDRQEASIGFFDGQIDPSAIFWAISRYGDIGLLKSTVLTGDEYPLQEIAVTDNAVGEGAYHIGAPRSFWLSEGGWWSVGAIATGNSAFDSVSAGGMSGGGIFNLQSDVIGVTSTTSGGADGAQASLTDRQDAHDSAYNPTIATEAMNVGTSNFFYVKQFVSEFSPSSVSDASEDYFVSGALQLEEKVLEAGWYTGESAVNKAYLKRYLSDGSLDADFGSSGFLLIDSGEGSFTPVSLLTYNDHIYVVGTHNINQVDSLFIARLDASGNIDTAYGQSGFVKVDSVFSQHAASAVFDDLGNLFIAGTRYTETTTEAFVSKIIAGALDTSFGDSGYAMQIHSDSSEMAADLGVNSNGQVFLLSTTDQSGAWDYGLNAFTQAGQVYTDFGMNGQILADYENEFEIANKVLVLNDGVIISGYSWVGVDENPLLFKYDFAGNLDTAFGDSGQLYINLDQGGNNFLTDIKLTNQDQISLLISGTRRIQANEGWGDIIEGSYTTKLLNISTDGQVLPDTGLTFDANGIQTNYSAVFVDGSELMLIRQLESSTGFSSEVVSTQNNNFSQTINLSGLNYQDETPEVFSGTELDDFIESKNTEPVTLYGLSGDDLLAIRGVDSNGKGSTLYGGPGDDRLYGWDGDDILYGGTGFDHFSGQRGDDIYYIDKDSDGAELAGFEGFDSAYIPGKLEDYYFWGSESTNYLSLKNSPSTIIQSFDMEQFIFDDQSILTSEIDLYRNLPSQDELIIKVHDYLDFILLNEFDHSVKLSAGVAHNNIWGTSYADVIDGGAGNDDIWGQDGNDTILGGYGDDKLNGGGGSNVLWGGDGQDIYYMAFANISDYKITINNATYTFTSDSGDSDELHEIEFVSFADIGTVSLLSLSETSVSDTGDLEVGDADSPTDNQSVPDSSALAKNILDFDFDLRIPEGSTRPELTVLLNLSDEFSAAEIAYYISDETGYRADLKKNASSGYFEHRETFPEFQIGGEYFWQLILTDNNGQSIDVDGSMLKALGFESNFTFINPGQDKTEPLLDALTVSLNTESEVPVVNVTGKVTPQGPAGLEVGNTEGFLTFPNSNDSYKVNITVNEDGTFSGAYEFNKYVASGIYELTGMRVTTQSGEVAKYDLQEYEFEIDNPNQDIVEPVLSDFSIRAVFDPITQRPKIIIDGLARDDVSGIGEGGGVFVRMSGPYGTSFIDADGPSSIEVTQHSFLIELEMLAEYLPGEYLIEDIYLYDVASNRNELKADDVNDLGFESAISVYFSTNEDSGLVDGSVKDDFVFGSDAVNDQLFGNEGDDYLYSGAGDDQVSGGLGNDTIVGGSGEGDDIYDGGDGIDSIVYTSALSGIQVNLSDGFAVSIAPNDSAGIGYDLITGIENITAGNFDDLVIGSSSDNKLWGGSGNDELHGRAGDDYLYGEDGVDTAVFSDTYADCVITYNSSDNTYTVSTKSEGTNVLSNIETLLFNGVQYTLQEGNYIKANAINDPASSVVYQWSTQAVLDGVSEDPGTGEAKLELTSTETGRVISAADALAALKLAVGINPNSVGLDTSPYQFIAADVNQDGRVSAADALSILKMAVGLSGAPGREWLFVNENTDFFDEVEGKYSINRSDVDWETINNDVASRESTDSLVAVLKGDVNGSWEGDASMESLSTDYFTALETAGIGPAEQWWIV
jgi:uncharacterized delta-60 repeat protein